jgi:hypothetical protein
VSGGGGGQDRCRRGWGATVGSTVGGGVGARPERKLRTKQEVET